MARREAMAIVVTRCLSPLGTGNDETGSFGLGVGEQYSAHCPSSRSPSLVEISVCGALIPQSAMV
jgi:hypothetical protein